MARHGPDHTRPPGNLVNVGYAFKRYADGSEALLYSGPTSVGKVRVDGGRFDLIDVMVYPGAEANYISPDDMRRALGEIDEAKMLSPRSLE